MRASRLLAILILLQNRGRLTAEALAEEFEVSERTIYRDIDALSMAGVPVYGDRGPGGGFALLDGYRTRLTGLADDEAAALALAGVPSAAEAAGFGAALRDAFGKLFAALPGEGGARAEAAAARFHIDPADWYRGAEVSRFLPDLARAVLATRRVTLRYESWTATRDWTLDPLGLVLKAGEWYLIGRVKERVSTYRVGTILKLEVLEERFEAPANFDLARWWRQAQAAFEDSLFTATARLRASPTGCERLKRLSPRGRMAVATAQPGADGWVELTMPVEDNEHGARELIGLGPEIEVLAPASLRHRIAELAAAIAQLHEGDPG
jgi:predicted DNA-binding transcriptional regulator YafY